MDVIHRMEMQQTGHGLMSTRLTTSRTEGSSRTSILELRIIRRCQKSVGWPPQCTNSVRQTYCRFDLIDPQILPSQLLPTYT